MGKSASNRPRMNLFNDEEQTSLDDVLEQVSPANPAAATVECLGRTFESEAARRAFYLDLLRQKLQDPAFRQIEGFPTGQDEDILALSDPPYYTACPNPFIEDFIRAYGIPYAADTRVYRREPFAADVSEGKNDPIYNAHSYHTKVPHKAIMRYILHYTEPGDLVFDGFCGTGMTGVAAQLCGDKATVESLGYLVQGDGTILGDDGQPFSRLGARRAILNDLSPAATFIAYNYNTPFDAAAFEREARRILKEVEDECGWMYETLHTDGKTKGRINYTVWSDVFICPNCSNEVVFWDVAVDREKGQIRDEFPCPFCQITLTKRNMKRAWTNQYDKITNEVIQLVKLEPVLINYSVNNKRFEKKPDESDVEIITSVYNFNISAWFPTNKIPSGKEIGRLAKLHINDVSQLLPKRAVLNLATFLKKTLNVPKFRILITASLLNLSWLYRWRANGKGGTTSGTYYICATPQENNAIQYLNRKLKDMVDLKPLGNYSIMTTQASQHLQIPNNSFDYIFLDPPFGYNLMYSELNFLWEAWLKVFTNNKSEAIENSVQDKDLEDYRDLMLDCFKEAFRVLKPGRWMTIEFSNTQAAVWNSIQSALQEAGFVVANVAALDKQQGSFKAVTTTTAVKQDLVISAYKPNGGLEARFERLADSEEGVWQFISSHLSYLPTVIVQKGVLQTIAERDPRILYDRLVAYYVQHIRPVPVSSREFQEGLRQRFPERDGMYFLPTQVVEYDRKRLQNQQIGQQSMFVDDERSAIFWLQNFLKARPSTYQEIQPEFLKQLGASWKKYEARPELLSLLEDNFVRYEGTEEVPPQIHGYLSSNYHELRNLAKDAPALRAKARERWYVPDPNRAEDLEKKREQHLLREFEQYRQTGGRKLKLFRLEALRAGFRAAWQRGDYALITEVGRKLPDNVLQEDEKLLLWYDQAQLRQTQSGKTLP